VASSLPHAYMSTVLSRFVYVGLLRGAYILVYTVSLWCMRLTYRQFVSSSSRGV